MSKEQRRRALSNAGKRPRPATVTPKENQGTGEVISCNQTVVANSENSALGSSISPTALRPAGPRSPTVSAPEGLHSAIEGQELSGYGWYEEYVELSQRFAWRLAAYIACAAATQQELARVLGLKTDCTIRQWKEKNPTIDKEIEALQAAPL